MVEQPARLFLKEGGVGVNEHCLLLLHRAVATASQPCRVVKVTGSDGLRSRQERCQWKSQTLRNPQHALPAFSSGFRRTRKVRSAWRTHWEETCSSLGIEHRMRLLPQGDEGTV